MIRNPNDSKLQAQIDDLRGLTRANPLRSMSVEQGRTRFYNNSQLLIEDSNLDVTGTATIIGHLRVVGRVLIEGLGILTVNGLIELLGRMRVSGGGGITVEDGGDVVVDGGEIRADDVVIKDGRVYIGDAMVLDPAVDGGAASFSNGSKLYSNATAIGLRKGTSAVTVGDSLATLLAGGKAITVSSDRIDVLGLREVPNGNGLWKLGLTDTNELVKYPAA